MKKNIIKQKQKTHIWKTNKEDQLLYKLISNNKILPLSIRTTAANKCHENHLKQHVRKVCLTTGRSRGLIKRYRCSRIKWKGYIQEGLVAGVKKSSW
jgi:small subunit ribosomal protein S14